MKVIGQFSNKIWLVTVIASVVMLMLFCGFKKEYLYQDEVLSYSLANDELGGYIDVKSGTWTNTEELFSMISVSDEERFDYKSTFNNQAHDSHPPIYAFILKTICSLFPGKFSKWYGLSINIVSLVIVLILTYILCNSLLNDEQKSLIITALYGFSIAVMTQTMFIRMYVLLQIFTTLCAYIHVISIKKREEKIDYRFFLTLCFNTVLGVLTHYYYLVFAFFVAAFYSFFLVVKKKYSDLLKYIAVYTASFATILILYRPLLTSIFTDEESVLASDGGYVIGSIRLRISTMLGFINTELFGGIIKVVVLIVVVYFICLVKEKKVVVRELTTCYVDYMMLIIASAGYFLVVSLVSPYLCDRHIFPIFNLVFIVAISIMIGIFDEIFNSRTLGRIVLSVLCIVPLYLELRAGITDVNTPLRREIAKENGNIPCIFTEDIYAEENIFDLMQYDDVFFYDYESELTDETVLNSDELVVYVPDGKDEEECFNKLREKMPWLTSSDRLYVGSYSRVYKLY